ncbi:hypothetical protein GW17_00054371 [Ensete ventricosum]|nr:hypothetical protein GW17_00054371 [Ensete ventricosum]
MFNGFDAFGYTGARPCTERCLRRFPGSGSGYNAQSNRCDLRSGMSELSGCRCGCPRGPRADKLRLIGRNDMAVHVGVHFVGTLIDRVHDTGRVVRLLTERNLALWAENKELKAGTGPEAVAVAEKRATELSAEVDWLKVALKKSEQCRKDLELVADSTYTKLKDLRDSRRRLEDEVLSLTKAAEVLQSKLKAEGRKAVTYELGYRVVLERFRAKYPESYVEEDPFAEWSEDANIRMEACQPFDDSTMPEE